MKPVLAILFLLLGYAPPSMAQPAGMVRIPGGNLKPFLYTGKKQDRIKIHAFYLDAYAVTNEEFLSFVRANPEWARSKVARIFADDHYLKQWAGDFEIGDSRILKSPVTNISWFAAHAYCQWKGRRLPTMAEWEYAAAAAPVNVHGAKDLTRLILEWYDHPTPAVLPAVGATYKNIYGVYDMHGLIWEWVGDFNSIISDGEPNAFTCGGGSLGTTDKENYAAYMRYAFRESLQAAYTVGSLGFRCAQDIGKKNFVQH